MSLEPYEQKEIVALLIIFEKQLKKMETVYADIELINLVDLGLVRSNRMDKDEVRRIRVNMLTDSGAYMMAINENILH